jgi:hypothetical protein
MMRRAARVAAWCMLCMPMLAACACQAPAPEWREAFPGVRVNVKAKAVEFDGIVPIDAHSPQAPVVYLEVVVCSPDTREHETLVVSKARPSHVHAALLLVGLKPGSSGSFKARDDGSIQPVDPTGDPVDVIFTYAAKGDDGVDRTVHSRPQDWIVSARTGKRLDVGTARPRTPWLFGGSRFFKRQGIEVYDADGAGTLIGLATFGSETVGYRHTFSPDSEVDDPEWIADAKTTPAQGTSVTVRISAP